MLFVAVYNYFLSLHEEAYIRADICPEQDAWASWVQVEGRVLAAGQRGSLFPDACGGRFLSRPHRAGASCCCPRLLAECGGLGPRMLGRQVAVPMHKLPVRILFLQLCPKTVVPMGTQGRRNQTCRFPVA